MAYQTYRTVGLSDYQDYNLEQVIYTHGAQVNSAFHPFGEG